MGRSTWRLFWRSSKSDLCGRKYSHKVLPGNFSGKFREIRAKIVRTPKNWPAPTPMAWKHTVTATINRAQKR